MLGDALLANRLLLALVLACFPVSLRSLLRALERDERIAIFGCMLAYNRALIVGFLPFVASIPLAVFALAVLVRQLARPTPRRALFLALLALALFYTHVSSFVLFVPVAASLAAVRIAGMRRVGRRVSPLVFYAGSPLVPSAVAAVAWWRSGSLGGVSGEIEHVGRLPLRAVIDAVPIWTFEIWPSHVDELCAATWWLAFAAIVIGSLRRPAAERPDLSPFVPFACTAIVYLVTPFAVGPAGYLNLRLAPLLTMFALLGLRPPRGRLGEAALIAAAMAGVVMAGDALFEMRRIERDVLGDIDALLQPARPKTRLAMLNFETRSPRAHFYPYVFAGSYHRAFGGDVASYSFTELPHWPVHYAKDAAPARRRPFWAYDPCAYRYRSDGAYYDYVLVQGDADPFAEGAPGPTFTRVGAEGRFALYEKTGSGSETGSGSNETDRGPCPSRAGGNVARP